MLKSIASFFLIIKYFRIIIIIIIVITTILFAYFSAPISEIVNLCFQLGEIWNHQENTLGVCTCVSGEVSQRFIRNVLASSHRLGYWTGFTAKLKKVIWAPKPILSGSWLWIQEQLPNFCCYDFTMIYCNLKLWNKINSSLFYLYFSWCFVTTINK